MRRHPIRLCGRPAADRPTAVPAVLPGQEAVLSPLQPLSGRDREVRGGDGREQDGAVEGPVRALPEARGLRGRRHPQRLPHSPLRGAARLGRQGDIRRDRPDCQELSRRRALQCLSHHVLLLQVCITNRAFFCCYFWKMICCRAFSVGILLF